MANYGNGGGYSTTTYGAQGGADGGGFMGGSQQGSQDGGSKTYGKDTVRPVTIRQILEAQQPHSDSDFKIDGSEVTQLSFIGQIHNINSQTTNHTYSLDDGTGLIDVKQWIDSDQDPSTSRPLPKEGEYVHVWGRLKAFNNKRHIGAHVIRPVDDYNEVSMALLEATAVHLYFTQGPPGANGAGGKGGANGQGADGGMFVGQNQDTGMGGVQQGGARSLPRGTAAGTRRVYDLLQSTPQSNEGLHVSTIAQNLGMPQSEVFKAGDELLADGLIYTTVDDETWAVLEMS